MSILNILDNYFEISKYSSPLFPKEFTLNVGLCICQKLLTEPHVQARLLVTFLNNLVTNEHYSNYGGSHRTARLDRIENVLMSRTNTGTLPNNRRTYDLSCAHTRTDDAEVQIAFLPIQNYDQLWDILRQNKREFTMSTNLTRSIDYSPLLFDNLQLIVGCHLPVCRDQLEQSLDDVILQTANYSARYILAIRKPDKCASAVSKLIVSVAFCFGLYYLIHS